MGLRRRSSLAFGLIIALSGFESGCFKWKSENASEAVSSDSATARISRSSVLARLESSSNLVRSSGEVLLLRLSALFPRAAVASGSTAAYLNFAQFESLTASGINRALADENRPASALAQVALRKWVAPLCKVYLDAPSGGAPAGTVFSDASGFLTGEKTPTSTPVRESLLAARNIWLDLFTEDSPEVQALSELYTRTAARTTGGGTAAARQTICMAALLSPQFLIGNLGPRDVLRRASLEIARSIPALQDLRDFELGKLTLDSYLVKIQEKPSYLLALKSWHRDWWGLREFRTKLGSVSESESDPRGGGGDLMNFSEIGSVALVPKETFADGRARVEPNGRYRSSYPSGSAYQCNSRKADGSPNLQSFDPRTVMVVYEHFSSSLNRWEIVGGYVHSDRLTDYQDLIRTYDTGFNASTRCELVASTDPKFRRDVPNYYRCGGSVTGASGAFLAPGIEDFLASPTQQQDSRGKAIDLFAYPVDYPLNDAALAAGVVYKSVLAQSVHAKFKAADRRVRRLAPTGWQDGISAVKTWWSGDFVYVCNSFERYRLTCPFRASNTGRSYESGYGYWYYVNQSKGYTPRGEYVETGAYTSSFFSTSPLVLNQFRCGVPNVSEIPLPVPSLIPENSAYPRGFEISAASYLNPAPLPAGSINDLAFLGAPTGVVSPLENSSIARLQEDLKEEPYRLLEHVLKEKRPYSDMVQARYTLGREELELAYRSHFLFLPTFPPGYTPSAPDDRKREQLRLIRRAEFPAIPANWTKGPYNLLLSDYRNSPKVAETGLIPPAPAAGILTMPAFLGPVSQKMRVISSRVFERLLCGSPNLFVPQGSQAQLHERYMTHPKNPAPPAHMDGKSGCYSCHVNLDPLGAALSGTFLENVQKDETRAMEGQFIAVSTPTTGRTFLGGKVNSETGEGAFLGQAAKGFTDVGDILADSPLFYRCTATRAFEKVLGRTPTIEDLKTFDAIAADFQQHRDFNRLIRQLATSSLYRKEN